MPATSKPPAAALSGILEAQISEAPRRESHAGEILHALRGELAIGHTASGQSWCPGRLHHSLSWPHYRTLLRVENSDTRAFYEIEAVNALAFGIKPAASTLSSARHP